MLQRINIFNGQKKCFVSCYPKFTSDENFNVYPHNSLIENRVDSLKDICTAPTKRFVKQHLLPKYEVDHKCSLNPNDKYYLVYHYWPWSKKNRTTYSITHIVQIQQLKGINFWCMYRYCIIFRLFTNLRCIRSRYILSWSYQSPLILHVFYF